MKRILLVGNYGPDRQNSMLAYAQLIKGLLKEASEIDIDTVVPQPVAWRGRSHPLRGYPKLLSYIDKYLLFPFKLWWLARGYDVIHICDHSNAVYAHLLSGRKVIVTCHDVLAIEAARGMIPGSRVRCSGRLLQALILKGLRKARHIIADSEYTREHLVDLGVVSSKVTVALLPLNAPFHPASCADRKNFLHMAGLPLGARYCLHVGSDLPRKNRDFVLEVFAALAESEKDEKWYLVFVGPGLGRAMRKRVEELALTERVKTVQQVRHEELNAAYGGAEVMIFPSLWEGFGWPLIEAQAAGCPVLTSKRPPMDEVVGETGAYLDLESAERSAATVMQVIRDREYWIQRGFANLERFSSAALRDTCLAAYG